MAMDVLERLNRKFGVWYEGLVGGGESRDLRPRDILRRILSSMEDGRREALDGQVYVPNVYTLQIAVSGDDERSYLRTFLSAEDLTTAVMRAIEQHGYNVRGALVFHIEETAAAASGERVRIQHRFDAAAAVPAPAAPSRVEMPNLEKDGSDEEEPGTLPAALNPPLASLVVRGAEGRLEDVFPLTTRGARIGRGRQAGNDIVVPGDALISKSHAAIRYEQGQFLLTDAGSTNGTFLRGERLSSGRAYPLRPGDEIRLGDTTLLFRPTSRYPLAAAETPPLPASSAAFPSPREPAPPAENAASGLDARGGGGGASTFALENRDAAAGRDVAMGSSDLFRLIAGDGEAFPLASSMGVGRSLTSDIVVIGNGVATQHARLFQRGDILYVEDLSTVGGTQVNGERIPANFPVALYEGDQVGFGEVQFRLQRGTAKIRTIRDDSGSASAAVRGA